MGGIEGQGGAALGAGLAGGQGRPPAELAHLARELAGAEGDDRQLVVQAVAPYEVDRALEQEPGRHMALADVEDGLARGERPRRAAGEAPGRLDLQRLQNGKHLLATGVDKRHRAFPPRARPAPANLLRRPLAWR